MGEEIGIGDLNDSKIHIVLRAIEAQITGQRTQGTLLQGSIMVKEWEDLY